MLRIPLILRPATSYQAELLGALDIVNTNTRGEFAEYEIMLCDARGKRVRSFHLSNWDRRKSAWQLVAYALDLIEQYGGGLPTQHLAGVPCNDFTLPPRSKP